MIIKLQKISMKFEKNFFLAVTKRSLSMMIPFVMAACVASAIMNIPIPGYKELISTGSLSWIYDLLDNINKGCYGLFSVGIVITMSLSYAMEKNEPSDSSVMYAVVSLAAFCVQLNVASPKFDIGILGVAGCFSAVVVTFIACQVYSYVKKIRVFSLEKYTAGMGYVTAIAIQNLISVFIVIGGIAIINQAVIKLFGVYSIFELTSNLIMSLFKEMKAGYLLGLLYNFVLHVLWLFGFHGSNILEPVAVAKFGLDSNEIFSKAFFDTYVVMGGCGTTICVLLALLIFYRKDRISKLAKIGVYTVIFNINEVLNFGLPIVLNPVFAVPFICTPIVVYSIAYAATYFGIVPPVVNEVTWTTPVLFSGYMATGSIKGSLLQLFCIMAGIGIYMPFLHIYKNIQEVTEKERIRELVGLFKEYEERNEEPDLLARSDKYGSFARILLQNLKADIKDKKLYLLFQPQIKGKGHCIGAEALLRWEHSQYGFIYPPLIIALAKDGGILEELEREIFDMAGFAIRRISEEYKGEFKISVNITAKSLLWDIEKCIDESLKKYDIPAEKMWIEITEQDVLSNSELVVSKLEHLKEKGHTLLIDDFGMGHTSLVYLQSSCFDMVKLDGSLVRNVENDKTNQRIIESIVELGNNLGAYVIAEYVENVAQRDKLAALGCNLYQGYFYSKPILLDDFITYINKQNGKDLIEEHKE